MSYTIYNTAGQPVATIGDALLDETSTSLDLVGQNYIGYGDLLQDNLVRLLENFAFPRAPRAPIPGQLWFDSNSKHINLFTTSGAYKTLGFSVAGMLPPAYSTAGDTWFDTDKDQLKIYDGAKWIIVGPVYNKYQGVSGANVDTVTDSLGNSHTVVKFMTGGQVGAIYSSDAQFTLGTAIQGFTDVYQGFTISDSIGNPSSYRGTVYNTLHLGGIEPGRFLRHDQNEFIDGSLTLISDNGLIIGSTNNFTIYTDSLNNGTAVLENNEVNGDIVMVTTNNSGPMTVFSASGETGLATVKDNPVDALGIVTKQYSDINLQDAKNEINNHIISNVNVIESQIGVLTQEYNDLNSYTIYLNNIKADLASPALIGIPTAPTATINTSTAQLATTEFVQMANTATKAEIKNVTDNLFAIKANLFSPNLQGIPTAPPTSVTENSYQIATTNFVQNVNAAVKSEIKITTDSLNTLKAPKASPVFTGNPTAPTPATNDKSTSIATTAFVQNQIPAGVITMWYGTQWNIPSGWALCNGQTSNGYTTPDLRNRFIVGAAGDYAPGVTGGSESVTPTANAVGSHSHSSLTGTTTLTLGQIPSHKHNVSVSQTSYGAHSHIYLDAYGAIDDAYNMGSYYDLDGNYLAGFQWWWPGTWGYPSQDEPNGAGHIPLTSKRQTDSATININVTASESSMGGSQGHNHTISGDGAHNHTINPIDIRPKYYALCYIMKVI